MDSCLSAFTFFRNSLRISQSLQKVKVRHATNTCSNNPLNHWTKTLIEHIKQKRKKKGYISSISSRTLCLHFNISPRFAILAHTHSRKLEMRMKGTKRRRSREGERDKTKRANSQCAHKNHLSQKAFLSMFVYVHMDGCLANRGVGRLRIGSNNTKS